MKATMISTSLLVLAATAAQAQTRTAGANPTTSDELNEVVVTGSRIITNGNNSPTPVTVMQAEELMQLQPTTITDALNNLPVFQGSRSQTSAPNTTGTFGGGNPTANSLNLRNLGSARTLVLWDGQRLPPGNYIGIVDVDVIPQMLIQRVDVVTGGVSAVYGSDAIAGVVNYVTDKKFNGLKAEGQYGRSSRSDDQTWKAGIAGGMQILNGRGHIEGSYQHYDDKGLPRKNMRDYYRNSLVGATPGSTALQGSAANPYATFSNVTSNQNSFGGMVSNGTLRGQHFAANGVLSTFVHGAPTGSSTTEIGGDGSYSGDESLKAPLSYDQLFVRLDYDFTEALHFHTQASGTKKIGITSSNASSFNNYTFSTQNAFLPAAVRTAMGTATTFTLSKRWNQAPNGGQVSEMRAYTFNAGLDGTLGKYTWGVDANYGRTVLFDDFTNNINFQNLSAALDAVVNPAGQTVCNASLTNPAYANCVPLNFFGPTASSEAAMSYVLGTTHFLPWFKQAEFSTHIAGDVFDTWAGPVAAAISVEWRKQTFGDSSDALPTQFANCTGLRFNCGATTSLWLNAFANTPATSQTVKEGALEFTVPLLKDKPLAQSLAVNGAVRRTSYDFGGNAWTWKLGLDWHLNDSITLRATRSRDIQAPSLYALFQPGLVSQVGPQDRLTGQTVTLKNTNLGNPNLVSEYGNTTTAGVVWRPEFIPRFSVSLDGYHIKVDGAMINVLGYDSQIQDLCYASGGSSFYCTLQDRPLGSYTNTSAANTVTAWRGMWVNASNLESYGADLEVNYAREVRNHPASVRLLTTWQPHYWLTRPGVPTQDFGNVAYPNVTPLQAMPALRVVGTVNFGITDKLFFGLTGRYRGSLKPSGVPTDFYAPQDQSIRDLFQGDINLAFRLKPGNELFLNLRNVFDAMPPANAGNSRNPGYPGTDDGVGRYATVGLRVRY